MRDFGFGCVRLRAFTACECSLDNANRIASRMNAGLRGKLGKFAQVLVGAYVAFFLILAKMYPFAFCIGIVAFAGTHS